MVKTATELLTTDHLFIDGSKKLLDIYRMVVYSHHKLESTITK